MQHEWSVNDRTFVNVARIPDACGQSDSHVMATHMSLHKCFGHVDAHVFVLVHRLHAFLGEHGCAPAGRRDGGAHAPNPTQVNQFGRFQVGWPLDLLAIIWPTLPHLADLSQRRQEVARVHTLAAVAQLRKNGNAVRRRGCCFGRQQKLWTQSQSGRGGT